MLRPILRRTAAGAGVTMALALLIGGCASPTEPAKGKDHVQVATEADITRQVNQLAEQIGTVAGAGKATNPKASSAPCDTNGGDTSEQVRYVQGTYGIPVAAGQHLQAFQKVRDHWKAQGWTIDDFRVTEATGRGTMSIKAPNGGLSFTLTSTAAPDTLGLLVHSDCYRDTTYP